MDDRITAAEGKAPDRFPGEDGALELQTGEDPQHAIIWLHGLGADGHDFAPIVPQLGLHRSRPVRFVFPHAPVRPVTLNGGMPMRAWYDIRAMDTGRDQDEAGIEASSALVRQIIQREQARGIPVQHIVLAGFSQGGAIALHAGLRLQDRLAGLVALSTYLLFPQRLADERSAAAAGLPLFLAHGLHDPVVPYAMGEATANRLRALNQPMELHTYPMQHAVCPQEIEDIGRFLNRVFSGQA